MLAVTTAAKANKEDEAYTENYIGHRGYALPEAVLASLDD